MSAIYITHVSGLFGQLKYNDQNTPLFALDEKSETRMEKTISFFPESAKELSSIDRVSKLAFTAAAEALNLKKLPDQTAVIAASARGATETLEQAISSFITSGKIPTLTSPHTTAGGIATLIARLLSKNNTTAPSIGTSMACASFFEGILIAQSFILSKKASRVLVVGAEAPLTPFTIAQMKSLKLYSKDTSSPTPCRPFDCISEKQNTLVLGEGAGAFLLESEESLQETGSTPLAELMSIGFCQEVSETLTGMNEEGIGYQTSMSQAIEEAKIKSIDLLIAHAAGTVVGDSAELNAITALFGKQPPKITSTKNTTGHTFGASGAISLLFGMNALKNNKETNSILINASGFGGIVLSAILRRPDS